MQTLSFSKMQGLGNDFVVLDAQKLSQQQSISELATTLCDRHFGIGADGLILYWPSQVADARMQIMNADGSEAEMCGNGLRCFAQYLQAEHQMQENLRIETGAGILETQILADGQVQVQMGHPILDAEKIPTQGFAKSPVVSQAIHVGEQSFPITAVSMGNPHCVIRIPDLEQADWQYWGKVLEKHPAFPAKTNVEFVQEIDQSSARVAVWERGVGPTLACGTGACAVLVAGVLGGWLDNRATIHLPGGPLEVAWPEQTGPVWLSGPAKLVFKGFYHLEEPHGRR